MLESTHVPAYIHSYTICSYVRMYVDVHTCVCINFIGAPELLFKQNETIIANISEQMVLNCSSLSS